MTRPPDVPAAHLDPASLRAVNRVWDRYRAAYYQVRRSQVSYTKRPGVAVKAALRWVEVQLAAPAAAGDGCYYVGALAEELERASGVAPGAADVLCAVVAAVERWHRSGDGTWEFFPTLTTLVEPADDYATLTRQCDRLAAELREQREAEEQRRRLDAERAGWPPEFRAAVEVERAVCGHEGEGTLADAVRRHAAALSPELRAALEPYLAAVRDGAPPPADVRQEVLDACALTVCRTWPTGWQREGAKGWELWQAPARAAEQRRRDKAKRAAAEQCERIERERVAAEEQRRRTEEGRAAMPPEIRSKLEADLAAGVSPQTAHLEAIRAIAAAAEKNRRR